MKLEINLPKEMIADLSRVADWHGVLIDDVIKHSVSEDLTFSKLHKLGPWDDSVNSSKDFQSGNK